MDKEVWSLIIFVLVAGIIIFGISAFSFWMAYRNLKKLMNEMKNNK